RRSPASATTSTWTARLCSATTRGGASSSSTACSFLRRARGSASMKRYLILAEGQSGDPHYGKTMRGVVDYSPHPTVAILDSQRPGETHKGIPVVGTVADALRYE